MIAEGLGLLTVALKAYISFNDSKGRERQDEFLELRKEYRDARNSSHPDFSRDRIAKARQALKDFEVIITKELNEEIDKSETLV